jgi:hypothetical protein
MTTGKLSKNGCGAGTYARLRKTTTRFSFAYASSGREGKLERDHAVAPTERQRGILCNDSSTDPTHAEWDLWSSRTAD